MDRVPEEFAPYVEYEPGEEFLACWLARYVAFDAKGRLAERGSQWDTDITRWLFVLTNHRVRHIGPSRYRTIVPSLHWNIPLTSVTQVNLNKHPGMLETMITLRVILGFRPMPGHPAGEIAPQLGDVSFVFDTRGGLRGIYDAILWAARKAAENLQAGSGGAGGAHASMTSGPAGGSAAPDDPDSPIRFNAQDDP